MVSSIDGTGEQVIAKSKASTKNCLEREHPPQYYSCQVCKKIQSYIPTACTPIYVVMASVLSEETNA